MRKFVIAAALACAATAAPAWARDGSIYAGVEAGAVQPGMLNLELRNATVSVSNAMRIKHKYGYDVGLFAGYDFGMFRVEGEFGAKHASVRRASIDIGALTAVRSANVNTNIFRSNGHSNVVSAMLNGLLDLGPQDSLNGSVGVGVGVARARYRMDLTPSTPLNFSGSDSAIAFQGM